MRKISVLLTATLLAGCSGLLPAAMQKGATLILTPHIQAGGYQTQATVSVYTSASIDHLTIKLLEGTTELASKTIPQGDLAKPVTFSNLRANTTYTINSYAYLANNAQISLDGGSSRTFTTSTDDRPNILSLPVLLSDMPFNGIGSSSIQVANGGYSYAASESLGLLLKGSVTANVSGSCDYIKARLFQVSTGLEVATLQSSAKNPTFTFNELFENTNYNVWVEGYKSDALSASQSVALNVGSANVSATLSMSLPYFISTLVGTGVYGFLGDGSAATNARLGTPQGMALDAAGNLYIADTNNNCIRKVDKATGNISTVAGNKYAGGGFSGDGSAATDAQLYNPTGVAIDATGSLYIADQQNGRIRKVGTDGKISTLVSGLNFPLGVGLDAAGNLYIADTWNYCIKRRDTAGNISTVAGNGIQGSGGDGGLATNAQLDTPAAVAIDAAGNLYISEQAGNRIRKVDTAGNISTLVSGVNAPYGLAFDAVENLYIAAAGDCRIWKVDKATKTLSTVAGNGSPGYSGDGDLATSAKLNFPQGVAIDGSGNIYVLDAQNNRVRILQ